MIKTLFFSLWLGLLTCPAGANEIPPQQPLAGLWSSSLWGETGQDPDKNQTQGMGITLRYFGTRPYSLGLSLGAFNRDSAALGVGLKQNLSISALVPALRLGWVVARGSHWALLTEAEGAWWQLNNATLRDSKALLLGSFTGQGPGGAIQAGVLYFGVPSVAIELQAGWRVVRISGLSFEPEAGSGLAPSSDLNVDLGGPFAHAGITILWGLSDPWGGLGGQAPIPDAPSEQPEPSPSQEKSPDGRARGSF